MDHCIWRSSYCRNKPWYWQNLHIHFKCIRNTFPSKAYYLCAASYITELGSTQFKAPIYDGVVHMGCAVHCHIVEPLNQWPVCDRHDSYNSEMWLVVFIHTKSAAFHVACQLNINAKSFCVDGHFFFVSFACVCLYL